MEKENLEAGNKRTVSTKFNAENADLLLISKDNVAFRVHRLYLEAHSPVFKDMFELGEAVEKGAELPEVQLEETNDVLELGLDYVYPAFLEPFDLDLKGDFGAIRMFEKYEIARGTEAVLASLVLNNAVLSQPLKSESHVFELAATFVLASYLGVTAVRDMIVQQILDTDCRWQDLQPTLEEVAAKVRSSVDDCSKLGKLVSQRRFLIDVHRQGAGAALLSQLGSIISPSSWEGKAKVITAAFRMWEYSAYISSPAGLAALEKEHGGLFAEAKEASRSFVIPFRVTWDALKERLESLPTSIEG